MHRTTLFAALTTLVATSAAAAIVPTPEAREVPVTEASRPYLGAAHNLRPVDLGAAGYVETETLVSGSGQIFDWGPDGKAAALATPAQPFTGRILVRKPADKAKFSGVVVVELMNDSRNGDWPIIWGYVHDQLMANGDVWVGITSPRASIGLKKFDPARKIPADTWSALEEALVLRPEGVDFGVVDGERADALVVEGKRGDDGCQLGRPVGPLADDR